MSRKPGPPWIEINATLADSFGFVCLKDELKASWLLCALRYPDGDVPHAKKLGSEIGKSEAKAASIMVDLLRAGFMAMSPGGKYMLAEGWVRRHKTSTPRSTKHRATKQEVNGHDVTPIVTSHTPSQNDDCNAQCNGIATLQSALQSGCDSVAETHKKEGPPAPPKEKTTNSPNGEFVVAREEIRASKPKRGTRWPAEAVVPDAWLFEACALRETEGLPRINLETEAKKFANYWAAKSGLSATKIDWKRTWLNWCLTAKGPGNGSYGQSRIGSTVARLVSNAGAREAADDEFGPPTIDG